MLLVPCILSHNRCTFSFRILFSSVNQPGSTDNKYVERSAHREFEDSSLQSRGSFREYYTFLQSVMTLFAFMARRKEKREVNGGRLVLTVCSRPNVVDMVIYHPGSIMHCYAPEILGSSNALERANGDTALVIVGGLWKESVGDERAQSSGGV